MTLFSRANLHALVVAVVGGAAAAIQAALAGATVFSFKVLATAAAIGACSRAAGWLISRLEDPPASPPAAASLLLLALLLPGLSACSAADAGELRFAGPVGLLAGAAPGDSLRYTLSGPTVAGATQYVWSVTASPGIWGGLPSGSLTASPVLTFTALAPASWDSVTFTASFQGKNASRSSNVLTVSWKLRRTLLATGALTVDSSAVGPISLLVRPKRDTILVGQAIQLCAFWHFGSGHVAMRTADAPICGTPYASSFTLARRAVSAAEQGWTDGSCEWPACLLGVRRFPADGLRVGRAA